MGAALNAYERRMVELAKTLVGRRKSSCSTSRARASRAAGAGALREAILGIHARFGAMTLLIDHDVELIASTCVSTVVLDFGELIVFGPTPEVLKDPRVRSAYLGVEEAA